MDKDEPTTILHAEMQKYRHRSFESLQSLLTELEAYELVAPSGVSYQVEVQAFWDDQPNAHLRVMGAIDDGGLLSAFKPLCEDFIMSPNGKFVGE